MSLTRSSELLASLSDSDRQEWAAARMAITELRRQHEGYARGSQQHVWSAALAEGMVSQRWYDFAAELHGDYFHYTGD